MPRATSLLPPPKYTAELVAERSKPLRRRRIRAFGVLAKFLGLLRILNRFAAETNAAARRIHLENDDLDIGADGKRFHNVSFSGHACLAQGHEAGATRG